MTGSVEQLTQKIASLDRQTDDLKAKLDQTYGVYLQVLARVFQQQTLQACYQICTEGYPQEFLALSMTQRAELQQRLKQIVQKTSEIFPQLLIHPPPVPPVQMSGFFTLTPEQFMASQNFMAIGQQDQTSDAQRDDQDLEEEDEMDEEDDEMEEDDEERTTTYTLDLTDPAMLSDFSAGVVSSQMEAIGEILGDAEMTDMEDEDMEEEDDEDENDEEDRSNEPRRGRMTEADARELQAILSQVAAAITAKEPQTPVDRVLSWQDSIEHGIREQICLASYQVNQALQSVKLIPQQVPDRALEAASRADGDGMTKISHVIQMLVEMGQDDQAAERSSDRSDDRATDNDQTDQRTDENRGKLSQFSSKPSKADRRKPQERIPKLTHVIALQVRLAEIEFQDPLLMRWRRSIRELSLELQTLTRDYRKYQRKRSVAEAQVAWRSTWSSDR